MASAGTWPDDLRLLILDRSDGHAPIVRTLPVDLPAVVVVLDDGHDPDADVHVALADLEPLARTLHLQHAPSLALTQLLRVTESLPIDAALVAESLAYASLQGSTGFAAWLRDLKRKAPLRHEGHVLLHRAHATHEELVLNRPARANMINMALREALVGTLCALALDGTDRPILLTGAGRWFCAGGDIHEFGLVSSPDMGHLLRQRANLPAAVARVADRLHVHLHGAVIGAGVELAAFASRVTAHPTTTIRLPELGMGLLPGCGGTVSLTRRIGRQRLLYLCLTGVEIDCTTALRLRIIDAICDDPPRFAGD